MKKKERHSGRRLDWFDQNVAEIGKNGVVCEEVISVLKRPLNRDTESE